MRGTRHHFGTPLDARFMGLLESKERLIGFVGVALLFQYGLPFLCTGAFFFGVPARRLWTARIGMAAGADVNARNQGGGTALLVAQNHGTESHAAIIRLLKDAGARE